MGIGELAAESGLAVRTIRFYSDSGVLPPAARSEAGYRLYGADALARLGLVRTLRELGVDLADDPPRARARGERGGRRRGARRRARGPDPRAARAARRAPGGRPTRKPPPGDADHAQARPAVRRRAQADRHRLPRRGVRRPRHRARLRGPDALALPELPDDPAPEQVEAWIELAELVQDPDFRATIRRMSEQHASAPPRGRHARRRRGGRRHGGRRARRGRRPRLARGGAVRRRHPAGLRHRGPRRRSPTGSSPAPTAAPSATGSCWRSSTAGRPCRPPCPPGSG